MACSVASSRKPSIGITAAGFPFAPDSNWRWIGSVARDKVGDALMGYSLSGPTMYPAIAFTGPVPTDPLGTMEGEHLMYAGTGAQISSYGRLTRGTIRRT
jgi:hypothetical protein